MVGDNVLKIRTYKCYEPPKRKPSEWLYGVERSLKYRQGLFEDISAIVNQEAPIHFQLLCNRICEIYVLNKAGARIMEIIKRVLKDPAYRKYFVNRGDFIYPLSNRKIKPRTTHSAEKPRPIEWVAIEELAAAAEWLLEIEFGIPRDALIRETARIMGYERSSDNVKARLNKAINFLLKEGRVKDSSSQIVRRARVQT